MGGREILHPVPESPFKKVMNGLGFPTIKEFARYLGVDRKVVERLLHDPESAERLTEANRQALFTKTGLDMFQPRVLNTPLGHWYRENGFKTFADAAENLGISVVTARKLLTEAGFKTTSAMLIKISAKTGLDPATILSTVVLTDTIPVSFTLPSPILVVDPTPITHEVPPHEVPPPVLDQPVTPALKTVRDLLKNATLYQALVVYEAAMSAASFLAILKALVLRGTHEARAHFVETLGADDFERLRRCVAALTSKEAYEKITAEPGFRRLFPGEFEEGK